MAGSAGVPMWGGLVGQFHRVTAAPLPNSLRQTLYASFTGETLSSFGSARRASAKEKRWDRVLPPMNGVAS